MSYILECDSGPATWETIGTFPTIDAAKAAAKRLPGSEPNWWIISNDTGAIVAMSPTPRAIRVKFSRERRRAWYRAIALTLPSDRRMRHAARNARDTDTAC